jgi:predicted ABC-type sugar transport system permease subunit
MPLNISNLILQNSYVMILACGMLLCILTGGNVDLSVGSIVGFVGAVSAVFILRMDMPVLPAMLLSLLIGLGIGYYLDKWLGTAPWLMIIWLGFGFAAGFRSLYRAALQSEKEQEKEDIEKEEQEKPDAK